LFLASALAGCAPPAATAGGADDAIEGEALGASAATRDDNLAMGNPSGATDDGADENNLLMVKPQYALSYNRSRGGANWVSWHLSAAWKGSASRSNAFKSDPALPEGFLRVTDGFYTGSGFDRGHLCPSDDRDGGAADNAATFLLTNILPQAPDNNRVTWRALEEYARTLAARGDELYVVAGGRGEGGGGAEGGAKAIHDGDVVVPSHFWKVLVVLPTGSNDVARVDEGARVIAVDVPNEQGVDAKDWGEYRVSVDALEERTGFDFLSNVPASVQAAVEARVDDGPVD
jgi:endonuclease G